MIPTPAMAASMAASAVLTISRERIATDSIDLPTANFQAVGRRHPLEGDAVMGNELVGALRHAALGKICRACADHTADGADAGRNQAAVRQLADPERHINTVFLQVDQAVGQDEADVDVRVGFEERNRDGQDMQAAENDRRGDHQVASRTLYSPAAARSASSMSSRIRLQAAT